MKSSLLYLVWLPAAQWFSWARPCRIPPRAWAALLFSKRHGRTTVGSSGGFPFCALRGQFQPLHHHQALASASVALWNHHASPELPLSALCHNQESTCRQKTDAILRFISYIFQGLRQSFFKFWTLLLHLF